MFPKKTYIVLLMIEKIFFFENKDEIDYSSTGVLYQWYVVHVQ